MDTKTEVPAPKDFVTIAAQLLGRNGTPSLAANDAAWRAVGCLEQRGQGRPPEQDDRLLGWAHAYVAAADYLKRMG